MKEAFLTIAALLSWALILLARLLWKVLLTLLGIGVLYGFWQELTPMPEMPIGRSGALHYPYDVLKYVIAYGAKNWLALSLATVFVCALQIRRTVKKAARHASQGLTALVALMNYYELCVETEPIREFKDVGIRGLIVNGLRERPLMWLFGMDDAPELTATAVRSGTKVCWREDLSSLPNDSSRDRY